MLKLGKHKIEFYESIDSMPFCRFNSFNKFVMLDAELGSDVMAFDQKVGKIFQFLGKEMVKDALDEMYNLRNTYHNILSENNVRGLAFACLVRKIDGEPMEDFSVDNLKTILEKFSSWGLEIGHVKNKTTDVKKKLEIELELFFPNKFNNLDRKNIFVNRKKRILALCDDLLTGTESDVAEKIERYLLTLVKPKTFNGSGSYEIEFDKAFEELCHTLSSNANGRDVKRMTVKEVYILIELNNKQLKNGGRKSN